MLWLLEKVVTSLIFIISVHYLLLYLQNNLTIPKEKDMFYAPIKKYNKMYDIIKQRDSKQRDSKQDHTQMYSANTADNDTDQMKNELKEYIQNQFKR